MPISVQDMSDIDLSRKITESTREPSQEDVHVRELMLQGVHEAQLEELANRYETKLKEQQAFWQSKLASHTQQLNSMQELHSSEKHFLLTQHSTKIQELELALKEQQHCRQEALANHQECERHREEMLKQLAQTDDAWQDKLTTLEQDAQRMLDEKAADCDEFERICQARSEELAGWQELTQRLRAQVANLEAEVLQLKSQLGEKSQLSEQDETNCPTCGNVFIQDALFCRMCGQKRVMSEQQMKLASLPLPMTAVRPSVPQTMPCLTKVTSQVVTLPPKIVRTSVVKVGSPPVPNTIGSVATDVATPLQ
eukprot:TRINITY_DN36729_c0_g1_i2.p1 TRINITY_DN36729_c0_g1~~TRINITY_DN36729_c0_g1_i2.p1  ORF type:complete len:310 (+),score=55.68 TRINITY_DN36729_c0_g1_i2:206-1135(+)